MKQITVIRNDAEFIWVQVTEDKWKEEYWERVVNNDDEHEWILIHTVQFLNSDDVHKFAEMLKEIGFEEI